MDIRIEKTEKAIKHAFIELRSQKPLEKITIKELCSLAQINKSTFYSHYEDIYSLSEVMEKESVASILNSISKDLEYTPKNSDVFARKVCLAFLSHISLINILYAGKEQSCLANRLETGIKELIYQQNPEYRDNVEQNIILSYCIQGAYHAYLNNQSLDADILIQTIERIVKTLQPLY